MGTNTGLGIGIGIPFKNNALGGDKPYFPPELKAKLIGVWTSYGKKNTDADRNIIKNKIPNAGGDLEILNSAYKLNSGFGEYKVDFLDWTINSPFINERTSFTFSSSNDTNNDIITIYQRVPAATQSFKIKAKLRGRVLYRYYVNNGDTISISYYEVKEGINILPDSADPTSVNGKVGFVLKGLSSVKVEQVPSFEGAFVTDGIDDLITSTKTVQEMLGGSNEITVVSMIHQINGNVNYTNGYTNYIRHGGGFIRNVVAGINGKGFNKTGIYGYTSTQLDSSNMGLGNVINNILGDKDDYSFERSSTYTLDDAKYSVQNFVNANNQPSNEASSVAWYWTIIANKVLTTDEINQVIAYFNLDRTLKPDILCNITKQGITNDNHADFNNKLIDYSGNGRDIQMNNLAWKGGSGIAAKPFETIKDYTIVSDEARQKLTIYNEFSYKVKSNTPNHYWTVQSIIKDNTSYQVTIITDKDCYWINATSFTNNEGNKESIKKEYPVKANTPTQVTICGLNEFEYPEDIEPTTAVSYVNLSYAGEVTVTFIPSCKGGLLLDGVSDFGKVTGMSIYKDYTFIIEREFLNETFPNQVCLVSKSKVASEIENGGAFIVDNISVNSIINPYSFYKTTSLPALNTFDRQIVFQSKYKYLDKDIAAGTSTDSDTLWLGTFRDNDSRFANAAIYFLMSFPYSMSEFLIERQLKKHKLGTLYPNMVEFRPVIKANNDYEIVYTAIIKPNNWQEISVGDYVTVGKSVAIQIKLNNPLEVTNVSSNSLADVSFYKEETGDNVYTIYGRLLDGKSPQKISLTIEQDENYVKFEPVITSNVEYVKLDFYLNNYQKRINIGDYIPKDAYLRANFYLKNNVDELTVFTFNGVNIDYRRNVVDDTAFNIGHIYNYDSPQEVNITIDEYIRYEDIKQPYPVLLRFNDENGNEVSWGGKFKVGSTITRIGSAADSNLLPNIYNIFGLLLNGNQVTSSKVIVEKTMVFKAKSAYIFDNNEPKCILSPRLLRIPNSSYKILRHIPDISGHGNHGVIYNSAYAEGSGVNEDGSYQFDGVDDFVAIPTLSKGGKQVLMKVNWSTLNGFIYDQRPASGDKTFGIYTRDDVIAYSQHNNGNTYIDGIINNNIIGSNLSKITHNIVATCDVDNSIIPSIGKCSYSNSYFAQMSLYDFMLFDEISTDDKIKELNTYIGITPKVTLPNYYWDNYGKKNTDAKRGYIDEQVSLQKTGTSVNPLENFNISYEGMSGYNGYPVVFGANKTWETSNAVDYIYDINSTIIHITNVKHAANALLYSYVKRKGALANIKEIPAFRVTVKGLEKNSKLVYKYLATENATKESIVCLGNGIHKLPKSFVPTDALLDLTTNSLIGFAITPMIEGELVFDCDITIEILPEYENSLVYDGVSDFTDNKNIPILTDFTFIIKREILGLETNESMLVIKGDKVYNNGIGNAFILEHNSNGVNYVYSYGKLNQTKRDDSKIIYLTPKSYNGNPIIKGENGDNLGLILGKYWKGIIYKTILYSKTISLLEINFLKNLMERDEIIDLTNPIFIKDE